MARFTTDYTETFTVPVDPTVARAHFGDLDRIIENLEEIERVEKVDDRTLSVSMEPISRGTVTFRGRYHCRWEFTTEDVLEWRPAGPGNMWMSGHARFSPVGAGHTRVEFVQHVETEIKVSWILTPVAGPIVNGLIQHRMRRYLERARQSLETAPKSTREKPDSPASPPPEGAPEEEPPPASQPQPPAAAAEARTTFPRRENHHTGVGRAVLITGAETDIGRATAVRLARKGFRAVAAVRSEAEAAVVARAAEHARVVVETILLDVTDAERCAQVIDELRPYGLVNNGGYAAGGAVEHVGDSGARMALETTIVTPMRLARLALPHMRAAGEGRIVNISSVFGCATTPLAGWHQAAKHALEGLSDALRVEVASAGIRVILIEPGAWAEMGRALEREAEAWRGSPYEAAYRRYVAGLRWAQSLTNDSAASVAAAVGRAMIALWPRARYVVGYEAALLALAERTLPTALKDRIARLLLGL